MTLPGGMTLRGWRRYEKQIRRFWISSRMTLLSAEEIRKANTEILDFVQNDATSVENDAYEVGNDAFGVENDASEIASWF
jgi:hypothetical protein